LKENIIVTITYRTATEPDAQTVYDLILALAEYEKLAHEVVASVDDIRASMFGNHPKAHAVLAESGGDVVGFALYFYNYSTFQGKAGIYIEDLYVYPEHRGQGIGEGFFKHLCRKAMDEDCGRIQWWVLDWNEPSIEFYKKMGAQMMDEWTVCRLEGEAIQNLAVAQ
jgi:GNAT superfamily N-acetyltransferase